MEFSQAKVLTRDQVEMAIYLHFTTQAGTKVQEEPSTLLNSCSLRNKNIHHKIDQDKVLTRLNKA
jgi:hypothetical protein